MLMYGVGALFNIVMLMSTCRVAPVAQSQALFCCGSVMHELLVVVGLSSVTVKEPVGIGGKWDGVDCKGAASSGVCAGRIDVTVVTGTLSSCQRPQQ